MSKVNWFKDGVIYQIFIDRFAGYDGSKDWEKPQFIGGDIRGIIDRLPYLEEFDEHGDLQARKPMKWDSQDEDLLSFYKDLIQKRKSRVIRWGKNPNLKV